MMREDKKQKLNVRLDEKLRQRIRRTARKLRVSQNWLIVEVLRSLIRDINQDCDLARNFRAPRRSGV